jgi:hypothetical protein
MRTLHRKQTPVLLAAALDDRKAAKAAVLPVDVLRVEEVVQAG